MAWDDEKKARAINLYEEGEPTPENSVELVQEIAEQLNESPNGVRMILSKAGVYVKKTPATTAAAKTNGDKKAPRVSKEDAHKQLTEAIENAGHKADSEIISKLTGKAALYFAALFAAEEA